MAKKASPELRRAMEKYYAGLFLNVMIGMTKAESVEALYGMLAEDVRKLTKEQIQAFADLVGQFIARETNASPSPDQIPALKKRAIAYARRKLGI